jgi:hypothetical protein
VRRRGRDGEAVVGLGVRSLHLCAGVEKAYICIGFVYYV